MSDLDSSEQTPTVRSTLYQAELFPLIAHAIKANAVKNSSEKNFTSHGNANPMDQNNSENKSKSKTQKRVMLPAIPPKKVSAGANLGDIMEEYWYFVRSPREEYGPQGPHTIDELKQYKKVGVLKDSTLMWQDGLKVWMPLGTLTNLRNNLVRLPPVPDRHTEQAIYDPISAPPTREQILSCEKIDPRSKYMTSRFCSKCGSPAVAHLPQTVADQDLPDFTLLRRSLGSHQNASEVIPGLVWIGNSSTGRSKFFTELGVDLIVNCTSNLKTPDSKPPYYRCATIPLPEEKTNDENKSKTPISRAPSSSLFSRTNSAMFSRSNTMESLHSEEDMSISRMNTVTIETKMELAEVLEWFEKCYDFIENLRLYPDKAREGDPAPYDWTGPVDRYGRPIRTKEEIAIATATRKLIDENEGRDKKVLLWSRLGFDRPCVLAAAYLVRRWGLTAESAVDYIKKGRKGMKISEFYMNALHEYSDMHAIGQLLCSDCLCHQTIPMSIITTIVPSENESMEKKSEAFRVPQTKNVLEETIINRIQVPIEVVEEPLKSKFGLHPLNHFYIHRPYAPSYRLATMATLYGGKNGPEWTTLIDVRMTGKLINDEEMKQIINVFKGANILRQLQIIDLSDNMISCEGIAALCEALEVEDSPELAVLLLRNNRIGSRGATMITKLLEPKYSLHTLNLANNQIADAGGMSIIHALILPEKDLFDSEEYKDPDAEANASLYGSNQQAPEKKSKVTDDEYLVKNSTITNLDLSNNSLGKESLESLAIVMKSNLTLRVLHLDCLPTTRGGNYLNHIFHECRTFNKTLQRLSLADSPLNVNAFDHLMRVFDGPSILQQLNLTRCDLTALHLRKSMSKVNYSHHLTHLNLSGNKLTDQGISFVTGIFNTGKTDPPLRYLDLSTCGVTINGALPFFRAISTTPSMTYVDISDNNLHGSIAQMKELMSTLTASSLEHLNFSRCHLGVHGSISLFTSLLPNTTMKILLLAENDIKDSVDESLSEYLKVNTSLEVLDLGYNCLTLAGVRKSKLALCVDSSSSLERKLNELHINLVGNPCGPYELEFPGMARSKNLMRYGQEMLDGDEFRYHISQSAYEDYWHRRKGLSKIGTDRWREINFIS